MPRADPLRGDDQRFNSPGAGENLNLTEKDYSCLMFFVDGTGHELRPQHRDRTPSIVVIAESNLLWMKLE
jgi:hypothetical protein